MPSPEQKGGPAIFAGAHHQAFESADLKAAGRDMYSGPTVNVSITAPALSTPSSSTSTSSSQYIGALAQGSRTPVVTFHTSTVPGSEGASSQKGRGLVRIARFLRFGVAVRKDNQTSNPNSPGAHDKRTSVAAQRADVNEPKKDFVVVCTIRRCSLHFR